MLLNAARLRSNTGAKIAANVSAYAIAKRQRRGVRMKNSGTINSGRILMPVARPSAMPLATGRSFAKKTTAARIRQTIVGSVLQGNPEMKIAAGERKKNSDA